MSQLLLTNQSTEVVMKSKAESLLNKINLLENLLSKEALGTEEVSIGIKNIRKELKKLFNQRNIECLI
jgi:hypothetical protein